ncbi:DUF3040 domain-containing protein [Psychromicrobium xiongbiense]|uniref:DUF3040 domain-containing protein n=1 Tax=Psychromicrobium xiongbiense TaxID=3051184 RepID=UPI002555EBD7|nr:DUF3040 domain-containing protein [Psychromicrobium sp. YIM S02556]
MPLSEHEQRLLDQLEQQLHETDPKLASTLGGERGRSLSTRYIISGVLLSLVGLLVLLAGVASQMIAIGVLGFLIMGSGVYLATLRRGADTGHGDHGEGAAKPKSSFMAGLEDRWEERRREQ